MPSIRDLRKRITSVRNTKQTTRAMKMVSAAKLRRGQDAIIHQRPYATLVRQLFQIVSRSSTSQAVSPLISRELGGTETKKKKLLIVVVTSDRGFCGGFNGNVIKTALSWVKTHQAEYENIDLGFIGKRGHDYFKLKKHAVSFYAPDLGGKVTFLKGRKFADLLVDYYLSGKADEVKIIYNEFKNAISQRIVVENFLPFWDGERGGMAPSENAIGAAPQNDGVIDPMYVFRPNPADVLDALLNRFFAVEAFRILLESQAGEHGARMAAMENATKNADEMIRKLTIIYNKQRQAGITKEILEIIAGSESQNV